MGVAIILWRVNFVFPSPLRSFLQCMDVTGSIFAIIPDPFAGLGAFPSFRGYLFQFLGASHSR